jgi:hypothetical protein
VEVGDLESNQSMFPLCFAYIPWKQHSTKVRLNMTYYSPKNMICHIHIYIYTYTYIYIFMICPCNSPYFHVISPKVPCVPSAVSRPFQGDPRLQGAQLSCSQGAGIRA